MWGISAKGMVVRKRYEKLHVTPDEAKVWGMQGGH